MKNKALGLIKKPEIISLVFIIFLSVFLRTYHFSDWLHFELDQSRDAKVIDLAIEEGASNLPLLGPKAGGTFLRLGPAFYYFSYFSTLVFGNTPSGIAAIIMIFGILAVPLSFLFFRRYFDYKISLALVLVFAVSVFLVMYSRFSWNPNPLPFFTILAFYALLRSVDQEEKKKGVWLMIFSFSLAIVTHLHFLAFVVIPAVSAVFLIIKRPRIKWYYWAASVLIVFFLYIPPIINDIKTGGDNFGQFFKVAEGKSTKDDHNVLEKAIKNYTENSLGYFLVISGQEKAELPRVIFGSVKKDILCDQDCRDNLLPGSIAIAFFSLGWLLLFFRIFQEKEIRRRDFLVLVALWAIVAFGLYLPLAFKIAPRFFLLISAVPFVFLGLMLEYLARKNRLVLPLGVIAVILLIANNVRAIEKRFGEMRDAPFKEFDIDADKILKERDRVTLFQQYEIINYIENAYKKNNYPVYVNSEPFYRRSFIYHLEKIGIPRDDFRNSVNASKIYAHGNYFLIYPTFSNLESDLKKYEKNYEVLEERKFGTLTVFYLRARPEAITDQKQEFEPEGKPKSAPGVPVRYRWEEIFDSSGDNESVE